MLADQRVTESRRVYGESFAAVAAAKSAVESCEADLVRAQQETARALNGEGGRMEAAREVGDRLRKAKSELARREREHAPVAEAHEAVMNAAPAASHVGQIETDIAEAVATFREAVRGVRAAHDALACAVATGRRVVESEGLVELTEAVDHTARNVKSIEVGLDLPALSGGWQR